MLEQINPINLIDFYKADHKSQYPTGTEIVYSNFTPRMSRMDGVDKVVVFGLQYFIKEYLIDRFNRFFFNVPRAEIIAKYARRMDTSLGKGAINVEHIGELHDLGYLPITIKALPEGSLCPLKVPCVTIVNTNPRFFWLTNYLETLMSCVLWKPMTSATTALQYRRKFDQYAEATGYAKDFCQWQGHDFSFRGMSGTEDALISAAGHLLSFTGSDTVPAIDFLEMFYNADSEKELIAGSVPASEHSVMCMGGQEDEFGTFNRFITELYPNGVVSVVSDTWDFWQVVTDFMPRMKDQIMARNGRLVLRPDSGDPVKIICGDPEASTEHERKGAYECLWDVFGGEVNTKGFKCLDSHIGLIYGDSITLERQEAILSKLAYKGFSASNLVLGIGSYTYEYVTRDSFGFAMKATYGVVAGEPRNIFKNPKTDSGFKKSAKGLLRVNADMTLVDECDLLEEMGGVLRMVFQDGVLVVDESLSDIRNRLDLARN